MTDPPPPAVALPRVLMWHYVRDTDAHPAIDYHGITPAAFDAQLDAICERHEPISWPGLRDALAGGRPLPPNAVLLTFDDGLVDHADVVLPRLVQRGLPAVFFVLARESGDRLTVGHRIHVLRGVWSPERIRDAVLDRLPADAAAAYRHAMDLDGESAPEGASDPDDRWKRPLQRELASVAGPILSSLVEEAVGPEPDIADTLYLGPSQLAALVDAGMTLGGHTRTHPWLDAIDARDRRAEIAASATLQGRRAPGPWPFAYPYGGVPDDAATLLRTAGFSAAFTTDPDERSDPYRIGRIDGDDPGWATLLAEAAP